MRRTARTLAIPAAVGMFLVLVMGATVTNTGSAEGCGRSWPLCDGRFVPELAAAALIEYSHRAVTGIEGILVLALGVAAWTGWRSRTVRSLVVLMVGTLLLQAGMGAWAVLYPQTPAVLATHFGISLLCLASTFLLACVVRDDTPEVAQPTEAVSGAFRASVWGLALFCLVVVYVGAYLRHARIPLACIDWPLCNGQVVPPLTGPTGLAFAHRVAALLLVLGLAWVLRWSGKLRGTRPNLYRASRWTLGLAIAQCLSGAVVVFTRLELFAALAHAGLASLLFAALSFLCFASLVPGPRRGLGERPPVSRPTPVPTAT